MMLIILLSLSLYLKRIVMKPTDEYLAILRAFMQKHAKRYGILSMGIFGSVARGEQHAGSDLDVFEANACFYQLFFITSVCFLRRVKRDFGSS